MDAHLRELERAFRASGGEREPAMALLGAAERAGDDALPLARQALDALVQAFLRDRDEEAVARVLRFVTFRPYDRLTFAAVVDALACAGHGEAARRYRTWFPGLAELIGKTSVMQRVRAFVAEHAPTNEPVLLHGGESGSGYFRVALSLHDHSGREDLRVLHELPVATELAAAEFDAAAVPGGSLYVAYADAHEPVGWLEHARTVTEALGTRLIVSAIRGPAEWPAWLTQRTLRLPPLRERLDDLELLVGHFLRRERVEPAPVPDWLLERLRRHPWPGNLRELQNVLQLAAARAGADGPLAPSAWEGLPLPL